MLATQTKGNAEYVSGMRTVGFSFPVRLFANVDDRSMGGRI